MGTVERTMGGQILGGGRGGQQVDEQAVSGAVNGLVKVISEDERAFGRSTCGGKEIGLTQCCVENLPVLELQRKIRRRQHLDD